MEIQLSAVDYIAAQQEHSFSFRLSDSGQLYFGDIPVVQVSTLEEKEICVLSDSKIGRFAREGAKR